MTTERRLHAVGTDLPAPPYAEDTRAKGWRLELDLERLLQSDTWTICPAEIRGQLMLVWVMAWARVPCGSWPDDDRVIAAAIGMPVIAFQTHREVLMRGWRRHADGRLYHPVVTARVQELLDLRKRETDRKQAWRDARKQQLSDKSVPGCPTDVPRDRRGTPTGATTPEPEPEPVNTKSTTKSGAGPGGPLPDRVGVGEQRQSEATLALVGESSLPDPTKPEQWDFKAPPPKGREAHYVLAFLNRVTSSRFEPVEANLRLIRARLREASLPAVKRTIVHKFTAWKGNPEMELYLRPKTLFAAANFASYVEEARKAYEDQNRDQAPNP